MKVASSSRTPPALDASSLPRLSSKSPAAVASLVTAIDQKALPWIEKHDGPYIVIPPESFKKTVSGVVSVPGVEISAHPLRGRKITVRERHGDFQHVTARWPDDGMEAKRLPMIGCVLQGVAELRLGNYLLRCREGQFIFIPAGMPHPDGSRAHCETPSRRERNCDILWFYPVAEVLKCWICRSENGKHSSMPSVYLSQKNLCAYCDALFEDLDDQHAVRSKIRQGLLMTLLSSVQNEIQEGRYFRWLPQVLTLSSEEAANPIKRAQNYIRRNIGESLTIENVARHIYMSRSQFARKFREETGETFVEFLTRCRLEEAKMRLTTTNAQIADVSRHVGLKPRYFNHLFLQRTSMTPGDYRRRTQPSGH